MGSWENLFYYRLDDLPFVFLALVVAFTVHEFAHAWSASLFGDQTAKRQGRVTLNPARHLDVFGTILIFIAGFGWAKPVPVNRSNFKRPRIMGIIVSAAGPVSNLIIAFIGVLAFHLFELSGFDFFSSKWHEAVYNFFNMLVNLNVVLFIFNLIPIPPLDGYRIIEDLAPAETRAKMTRYEHWGIVIFLLLVFIPPLRRMTIDPLFSLQYDIMQGIARLVMLLTGR